MRNGLEVGEAYLSPYPLSTPLGHMEGAGQGA